MCVGLKCWEFELCLWQGGCCARGFLWVELGFFARRRGSVDRCGMPVSRVAADVFHLSWALPGPFLIDAYAIVV